MYPSILANCTSGGCGAKIGAGELSSLLGDLPRLTSPNLLVGYDGSDDAAVYQLDEKTALISTVDFFSPMVDAPFRFGRIAAANALSDVYAMGGKPILALNLVCFPEKLPKEMLGLILAGGAEKIAEAGAVLGGGHSIYDKEPKYGLSVNGIADLDHIFRNNTPKIGDALILTKPIGVGIVMAAHRGGLASEEAVETAICNMERLNRYAAEALSGYAVSACTDVTGFGLLGHLLELCGESVSAQLKLSQLPLLPEALHYAEEFLLTAAGQRNRNQFQPRCEIDQVPFGYQELLFDPQTSGGLLVCVDVNQAEQLLTDIQKTEPRATIIGKITEKAAFGVTVEKE